MSRKKAGAESQTQENRRAAVGYVRVSTTGQGESGISLDVQRAAIKKFAEATGHQLIEICEDVSSGVGAQSFHKRPGLKTALDIAAREGADLLVWGWDRLTRYAGFETQVKKALPDRSRVICAKEGNELRHASKAATLEHNEKSAQEISRRTKDGMAKRRAQGVTFGNPEIVTAVQPLGSAAYSFNADALVRQIADVLNKLDDPFAITYSEAAKLLNENGIRTLHHKEWNASRAREPVKKARLLLPGESGPESLPTFGMF